jgi:hypothetical protein
MKKKAPLLILATLISVFASHVNANRGYYSSDQPKKALTDYIWYTDPDLTDPVGGYTDVNTEVQRLRSIFTAYTFSATWTPGLSKYEYGYRPSSPIVYIYSDLQ